MHKGHTHISIQNTHTPMHTHIYEETQKNALWVHGRQPLRNCRNICGCVDSEKGCLSALKDWHKNIKTTF